MHPRNRHRAGYDFAALTRISPDLAPFVRPNPFGDLSIDFADPVAVLALNRALLRLHYGISEWHLPRDYLCPPVPGRADYLHHLADLLAEDAGGEAPRGESVAVLDIGVGANCVYPILGVVEYGWRFVGTEVDPVALHSARRIVAANPTLTGRVECRQQSNPSATFSGVLKPHERFAATLCNPPFHASAKEASAGTRRKLRNLGGGRAPAKVTLNFGGQSHELWCRGGELAFVRRMIAESAELPERCGWFTSLVSKRENLSPIFRALDAAHSREVRTIAMTQGEKKSRFVAWTFLPREQRHALHDTDAKPKRS